jgi:hypothetical protein
VAAIDVVPQKRELRPAQVPDNNCKRGVLISLPTELKLIVGVVLCATNLYHTSYTTGPVQGAMAVAELLARNMLPAVFVQVTPDVNNVEPAQSSFAGGDGCVTQILNVAEPGFAPTLETLTK